MYNQIQQWIKHHWMCSHPNLLPSPTFCLKSVHELLTMHNVTPISYQSTSPCAQLSCKRAFKHLSTWLSGFVHTPATPHHHHVLYSYTILGRAAKELYFGRNIVLFSLGLGHGSCLGFVLLKFLFACLVYKKCGFQNFWKWRVFLFSLFGFSTIFFSVLLQI